MFHLFGVRIKARKLLYTAFETNFVRLSHTVVETTTNKRFWSRNVTLHNIECNNAMDAVRLVKDEINKNSMNMTDIEMGLIVVSKYDLIIPVFNGLIQSQHITTTNEIVSNIVSVSDLTLQVCGFHSRASEVSDDSERNNVEREVDVERRTALDTALNDISDVSGEELLSSKYNGTSVSRIYRSFVCPRVDNRVHVRSVRQQAQSVAAQIEFGLRQLRADQASYLRNTDKSVAHSLRSGVEGQEVKEVVEVKLNPIVLILDNVRSAFNVGSLFRTAETVGVQELVTSGISPHPPNSKLRKTALGSMDSVPSRHVDDCYRTVLEYKQKGYHIVVMETATTAKCYTDISYPKNVVIVVGNEVTGVDTRIMEVADVIAEIPMFGVKNSLNVASAAPIVLFEVLRQWK